MRVTTPLRVWIVLPSPVMTTSILRSDEISRVMSRFPDYSPRRHGNTESAARILADQLTMQRPGNRDFVQSGAFIHCFFIFHPCIRMRSQIRGPRLRDSDASVVNFAFSNKEGRPQRTALRLINYDQDFTRLLRESRRADGRRNRLRIRARSRLFLRRTSSTGRHRDRDDGR